VSDEQREKYTPTTEEVETHWADVGFAGDRESFRRWLARERAATLEDLALMWERTAHSHGHAMNDADWEHLKLWCASVRVYSEHKYGANRAAGTETGETS